MASKQSQTLHVNDWQVQLIRSKKRRTLALEIGSEGITVRAPQSMRQKVILDFVLTKSNWIEKHLKNRSPALPPINLEYGATLFLYGKPYPLEVIGGKGAIEINDQVIHLPIIKSHLPTEESIRRKLTKWYRQTATNYLMVSATQHAQRMFANQVKLSAINESDIKVREYKRRWGSCNSKGELSFNWRIIMAPITVIDYVVIHELAHRKEFNHYAQFWKLVEQQMPGWRNAQQWLNENGRSLYQF